MSNEQTDALEQALFLLDTFAGEGVGHIYGNGQELDASDVCTELADAFDLQCEPGWHRVLAARLTATPSPSTDTLERREAMIAQNRTEFVADGDATRRKTDAEMCAERRDAATLLALTPSPRVDEGLVEAWRLREVQMIGAAISTRNWHGVETAYNQLRDKIDAALVQSRRAERGQ